MTRAMRAALKLLKRGHSLDPAGTSVDGATKRRLAELGLAQYVHGDRSVGRWDQPMRITGAGRRALLETAPRRTKP